jgi:hypothetical protein
MRRMDSPEDAYWVLFTYFDCCKVPLLCRGIELIDSGLIQKTYFEFAHDFFESIMSQYAHFDE